MIMRPSRQVQDQQYDLHGLLNLGIRSPHPRVIRHFEAEFGHFRSDASKVADLEVVVDRFEIRPAEIVRLSHGNRALERDDIVFGSGGHKVTRWQFAIQGLADQPTRCYCTGGIFSLPFLQARLVEQLIRYKLSQRGHILVHGCCVARGGKSVLLPGLSHSGKTNLALSLVRRGWQFQADDYAIVSASGQTLSFPTRLHFSNHVTDAYPGARQDIGNWHRLSMAVKHAIYLLTLGYGDLTEAFSIHELEPKVFVADTAHLRNVILLAPYTGTVPAGPFPIPTARAIERILAINQWEGRHFRDLLLDLTCMNANVSCRGWLDQEQQIATQALCHAACYEFLIPQQSRDFLTTTAQICDAIEQLTESSAAVQESDCSGGLRQISQVTAPAPED